MRRIVVSDELTIRFPGRCDAFAEGVEIGLLAARMAEGHAAFEAVVGRRTLDQARRLAESLGYRVTAREAGDDWLVLEVAPAQARPNLRLVAG